MYQPGFFFIPIGGTLGLSLIPAISRLRHLVGTGYTSDDIAAALREHQLLRDEEVEYERSREAPWKGKALWALLAASVAGGIVFGQSLARLGPLDGTNIGAPDALGIGILTSLAAGVIATVGIIGAAVRQQLSSRIAAFRISMWKGRAGEAWTRVATLGVKKPKQLALGMPVRTEVALGRATDHLFQALPRTLRKQLAALPDIVRRLESEAASARERVDEIDAQLVAFDVSNVNPAAQAYREALHEDLREKRAEVAARLAATVAALENIRLDLLRLQLGHASVQSVTASLEAAEKVGEQIAAHLEARDAVEAMLRAPIEDLSRVVDEENTEDDDADTPVGGVSAARI
jgi:hypothetical protein